MIQGFIVSKEGKLPDPKKVKTIVKMPMLKNLMTSKSSMVWPNSVDVL
jgi:hypothetical protein